MQKQSLFQSYLMQAASLIVKYDGALPLNEYLKNYFSLHKKFGSRDRKQITQLCYCYYRLGNLLPEMEISEKALVGLFFCSNTSVLLLQQLRPEWDDTIALPLEEKMDFINIRKSVTDIFSFKMKLSEGLNQLLYSNSMLQQPDLFIRIRPGRRKRILQLLKDKDIEFRTLNDNCLAFNNTLKIDTILAVNRDVVIQDYSSQRIAAFLEMIPTGSGCLKVWDCCAASGGKSILLYDTVQNIDLTVSDIRVSILQNLHKRFKEAGIQKYHSFVADLSAAFEQIPENYFDVILCDAPCSGSGTWARTPEQIAFFSEKKLNTYTALQQRIVSNAIPHLKKDGFFLYITCSVIAAENETMVEFIQSQFGLALIQQEILVGYTLKADTMFAAIFKKPA